ncbi:MAG: T9SS type A sorting domain-containing protein [Bacteroidota bacterium]
MTAAGQYTEVFASENGCDSTVTLTLNVNPTFNTTDNVQICQGDTYTFGTQTLNASGTYTEVFTSQDGCDSTVTLTLNVVPQINVSLTETICDNETFTFDGQQLSLAGTYNATFTSAAGCDSVVSLTLNVNPTFSTTDVATICQGESFAFGTQTLTTAGQYTEVFASENGCDSTVTLTLNVNPSFNTTDVATICQGESFTFGTQTLTTAGQYTEVFTSENGCDSTVTLTLNVNPTFNTTDNVQICQGDTYTFGTQTLNASGTYTEVFTSQAGCDSTVTLTLNVVPQINVSVTETICDGESFVFDGQVLSVAGTYNATFTSAAGCDSVVSLTLNVNPTFNQTVNASINQGQSFAFDGQNLTQAGTYVGNFLSAAGCDSIVTLNLTVNPVVGLPAPSNLVADNSTAFSVPLTWQDNSSNETGFEIFRQGQLLTTVPANTTAYLDDNPLNVFGSPVEYQVRAINATQTSAFSNIALYSMPANFGDLVLTLVCYDSATDSLTWNVFNPNSQNHPYIFAQWWSTQRGDNIALVGNSQFKTANNPQLSSTFGDDNITGIWWVDETLTPGSPFDLVTNINLGTSCGITTNVRAVICQGETFSFGTRTLTSAGIYTEVFTASTGIDSTVILTLDVNPTFNENANATICQGDNFVFGTQTLTASGTYTEVFTSQSGCDSTVSLTLNVVPQINVSITEEICDNETFTFNGQQLSQAGTYSATFTSSGGCDSVVSLTLLVNPSVSTSVSATICDNETFSFNGQALSQAGTYTANLVSATGCDSVVTLTLNVNPTQTTAISAIICENETFAFNGQQLSQAGVYTANLTTASGCDSTVTLTLNVTQTLTTAISAEICANETFSFNGQQLDQPGTYTATLVSAGGCDSVVNLTLSVITTINTAITADICDNETFNFDGQTLSQAGTYTANFVSTSGCDSVVSLTLNVNPTFNQSVNATINQGQSFAFNGQNLTQARTYVANLLTAQGCDSTVTLNLTVNQVPTLAAPTNLIADNGTALIVPLTWTDNSNNETGFEVFRDGQLIATLPANTTSYVDDSSVYVFGTPIAYQVRAFNATLTSAFSNTAFYNMPASFQELQLTFVCYDPSTDSLTWNVFNPNQQAHPFIYAQWWSAQQGDLVAPAGNSQFKTANNPQNAGTFGDDNITGIWWVDERLLPGQPFDLVFTIDLNTNCPTARLGANRPTQMPAGLQPLYGYRPDFLKAIDKSWIESKTIVTPNPFDKIVTLESDIWVDPVQLRVFNMAGQLVYQTKALISEPHSLNLDDLPKGVYNLEVRQGEFSITKRIVKN